MKDKYYMTAYERVFFDFYDILKRLQFKHIYLKSILNDNIVVIAVEEKYDETQKKVIDNVILESAECIRKYIMRHPSMKKVKLKINNTVITYPVDYDEFQIRREYENARLIREPLQKKYNPMNEIPMNVI